MFGILSWGESLRNSTMTSPFTVRSNTLMESKRAPRHLRFSSGHSTLSPNAMGWRGAPFAAVNSHVREEFDFGGNINVLAG